MNNIPYLALFNEAVITLNNFIGTSVVQVTATDADDPTYGNSARVVYSILQGQPYFSVEPKTGKCSCTPKCVLFPKEARI